jgi:GNAT superfamily N-acetyltransferase
MDWLVRRIRPSEGDRLREIRLRALRDAPGAFASTFEAESSRPAAAWVDAATARSAGKSAATFVAEIGPDWVGLIGAFRASEESELVELVSMWVAPPCRRLGVALTLIEEVVSWARSTGGKAVALWVARGNDGAMAAYQRAGFELTSEHQPHPSDPATDELRMVLPVEQDDGG